MGQAYLMRRGGRGSGLRAVSYAGAEALPARERKNTLAVISDIGSRYAYAQAERPETGEAGDVWVRTAGGSDISIYETYASLEVGILYVEQYSGEKWERMEAYIFDGTDWVQVSAARFALYERGTDETEITGGWDKDENTGMTVTFGEEGIELKIVYGGDRYATAFTKNRIDLTEYTTLCMTVLEASGEGETSALYLGATDSVYMGGSGNELYSSFAAGVRRSIAETEEEITAETTIAADISAIEGSYFIQFGGGIANATISEIYLL